MDVLKNLASRIMGDTGQESTSENVQLNHLSANLELMCIETEEKSNVQSEELENNDAVITKSKEQCLKIELSADDRKQITKYVKLSGYYHIIIAVDRSGSMSGSPMNQLKKALTYILEETVNQENVHLDIFLYNDKIHPLHYNNDNYRRKVEEIRAGGLTYFSVVFDKIKDLAKHCDKNNREVRKTVVIFMTDGEDTSGKADVVRQAQTSCSHHLKHVPHDVVVHVLGFSRDHDFKFLNGIKTLGKEEGVFRYCESSDGPSALKEKMAELYDYINDMGKELLDVDLTISENNKIVCDGNFTNSKTLRARVDRAKTENEEELASNETEKEYRFYADTWLYVPDPTTLPVFEVKVFSNDGKTRREIPCEITSVTSKSMNDAYDKVEWTLRILERNTDIVTAKVGEAIAQKSDLDKVEKRLVKLQHKVSETKVYNIKATKEERKELLDHVAQIQQKLDILHTMIANVRRGESDSVSMLARANDLRYQVEFSKHRRQRLMDQRVRKNVHTMKKAQEELNQININQQQIKALSAECEEFYMCTLSQMNVKEIMLDVTDKEDCIGFGLAVKRAEHVLDEPTAIRTWAISGTLVSRTSMMDAIEHKINVEGHLLAHGGFRMDNELGVATVGQSREPINAWLPMYVCETHWQRVKALIKPTLGVFCTLDPLGYNFKQIDVLFQVLGSMIGQLQANGANEHNLKMIFGFQRLCRAVLKDFDLVKQSTDIVKAFINSPVGRTKDIISNLFVLIGYIASLPQESVEEIMGKTPGDRKACLEGLWLSVVSECIRRGANTIYRESGEAKTDGILYALVKELEKKEQNPTQSISKADFLRALKLAKSKTMEVTIPDYVINTGVEIPVIETPEKNNPAVDKAMELWAQVQCGVVRNKNREDQLKAAKQEVVKWIDKGHMQVNEAVCVEQDVGEEQVQSEAAEEAKEVSWDHLSVETLQILAQIVNKICESMYPRLGNITSCMAFLEYWIREQPDFCEMDNNSGIPPESWIQGVKEALNELQHVIEECQVLAETESTVSLETQHKATAASKTKLVDTENGSEGDDDYTDDDQGSEWEEYEPEETPVTLLKKQWEENKKKEPNLGEVLCCICIENKDTRVVTLTRGLICQAVQYHRNSSARAGASEGHLKDLKTGEVSAIETLTNIRIEFKRKQKDATVSAVEKVFWQRGNYAILQAPTTWSFIGYLMNTYKDRGEGIADLVKFLTDPFKVAEIPCLEEKITIIIMGKWEENAILNNGNMWMPEQKMCKKFENVLGEEVWARIEVNMRSNIQIHVYRASDIPNRHGHCNSNPYIPNALRIKLGMPLLKVKARPNKLRSKLTR